MSNLVAILSSVEFWKIAAPAAFGIIAWLANERSKRHWERWQLKKTACLRALNIANAILSNYKYANLKEDDITPQYESVESIRACFNELACTCEGPEVLQALKKIMFEPVTPAEIVELRKAVRQELRMGRQLIDVDRTRAFVGRVICSAPK